MSDAEGRDLAGPAWEERRETLSVEQRSATCFPFWLDTANQHINLEDVQLFLD